MKYVAFLRGINVGGRNKLPMAQLRSICCAIGFQNVRTYIQSGNIIFDSNFSEEILTKKLESALYSNMKKRIPVTIRSATELESVISRSPFPDAEPAKVGVMLFAKPLPKNFLREVSTSGREEVRRSGRQAYIYYPDGMGRSRLKFPKMSQEGTVRNINTIAKLAELAGRSVEE